MEATKKDLNTVPLTTQRLYARAESALNGALSSDEMIPMKTVERRYTDLQKRWNDVQEAHDKYVVSCFADANTDEIATEDCWINAIAAKFYKLEIQTDKFMLSLRQTLRQSRKIVTVNRAKYP